MSKPLAEEFSRNGDQFLGRVYKNNDFDCQDFVEKTMQTVGIKVNLPGSNAWYRKMTWVGTPNECIKTFGCIPKGALLYILKDSGEPEKYKADGLGNASHIGIKTGRSGKDMVEHAKTYGVSDAAQYNFGDGAIHSSSSRGHVCTSKFADKEINGGWNRVGLWDEFDYGDKINSILSGLKNQPNTEIKDNTKEEVTITMEYAKVTGGALNLRAAKSTVSGRLAQIPDGETVNVVEKGDDWCSIIYNGITGFVMTRYLKFEDNIQLKLSRDCATALFEALKSSLNNGE